MTSVRTPLPAPFTGSFKSLLNGSILESVIAMKLYRFSPTSIGETLQSGPNEEKLSALNVCCRGWRYTEKTIFPFPFKSNGIYLW